ncbi:CopG family transcriptional regulator [Allochromatium palmeri]|uniref:CopG family transcriptional regulator n=1 Tax=Allochromatium palmeri TaxID=231048 RepID=A0A6N8EDQ7_9GAMM|nr:CopG family transcriptional regulator [Allochromatium palmeri]MTW22382.1 CopG family transcriptional regulator [Allochromatium palmeri]
MPLSILLTPEEEALLEAASRQSARSQSDLVRQSVRELCQRLLEQAGSTPYELGQDLFGAGHLADAPTDPAKRDIWESLHAKHRRLG